MDANSSVNIIDLYEDFSNLAANQVAGTDYRITLVEKSASSSAIIAPHGGSIERRTSAIARALAADDFNLYLFEGLDPAGSFEKLHITSHRFDEPRCLQLISKCDTVVAIHGCGGQESAVMLGGLDRELIVQLETAIKSTMVPVVADSHAYPGTRKQNICNRGRTTRGVQVELTDSLRGSPQEAEVIAAIREVLVQRELST